MKTLSTLLLLLVVTSLQAQPKTKPTAMTPDPTAPRPIAGIDSVFLEELTWMEVRDALKAGKTTVIVSTGGVEQNGPYLATGKHNYILRAATDAIARKLGNALVAPIIAFVPEGNIDPPTQHMKFPGTISLTEETFERLLTDICSSLKTHGFHNIILLGDSGGNQTGMKAVAQKLTAKWNDSKARVHFIPEFYNYGGLNKWLKSQGIEQIDEGLHDDFAITAQMVLVDPTTVRTQQRQAAGNFHINGVKLDPIEKTREWGRKIIDHRAETTVAAIKKSIGN